MGSSKIAENASHVVLFGAAESCTVLTHSMQPSPVGDLLSTVRRSGAMTTAWWAQSTLSDVSPQPLHVHGVAYGTIAPASSALAAGGADAARRRAVIRMTATCEPPRKISVGRRLSSPCSRVLAILVHGRHLSPMLTPGDKTADTC